MEFNFSKEELAEIYNKLNNWKWDSRLGTKPDKWDDLPNYNKYSSLTKSEIIKPYMEKIQKLIGKKECLRWHHIHNLGRTNLQFEIYWIKRIFGKIFRVGF